jgi:hypothetical protein
VEQDVLEVDGEVEAEDGDHPTCPDGQWNPMRQPDAARGRKSCGRDDESPGEEAEKNRIQQRQPEVRRPTLPTSFGQLPTWERVFPRRHGPESAEREREPEGRFEHLAQFRSPRGMSKSKTSW